MAADRVDSDLREAQAARGLPGASLRRRVLVAIDGRGQSEYLVRVARRLAERRDAPGAWSAWKPAARPLPAYRRNATAPSPWRAASAARASCCTAPAWSTPCSITPHAAAPRPSSSDARARAPRRRMFNRTLTQRLIQRGAHYELTIVSTPEARARSRRAPRTLPGWLLSRGDAALAVLVTAAAATLVAALAERWVGLDDLSMVFIVAVVLVAARTGMSAAVVAATLCFASYNFFFIEPRFTFRIQASQGVTTVVLFLLAAAWWPGGSPRACARRCSGCRPPTCTPRPCRPCRRRWPARLTWARWWLPARARCAAPSVPIPWWNWTRRRQPPAIRSATATVAPPTGRAGAGSPPGATPTPWARPTGGSCPAGRAGAVGVVGLRFPPGQTRLGAEQRRPAEAMAEEIAQALERVRLVADLQDARVSGETERLRSALLSSVSHDLRSPLAAIIGAAGSLESYAEAISRDDRHALLETIRGEGERLDRYIQNLLDMTRLGHGGLTLHRDWIGVDELIGSAVTRLQRYRSEARFAVHIAADVGPVWGTRR